MQISGFDVPEARHCLRLGRAPPQTIDAAVEHKTNKILDPTQKHHGRCLSIVLSLLHDQPLVSFAIFPGSTCKHASRWFLQASIKQTSRQLARLDLALDSRRLLSL
jgi:hypothetical protein